jgi:hypothetical protein
MYSLSTSGKTLAPYPTKMSLRIQSLRVKHKRSIPTELKQDKSKLTTPCDDSYPINPAAAAILPSDLYWS